MLDNIRAVIFDLDGTLVDSMGMWKDIDIEYLEQFGQEMPEELQKDIEGISVVQTAVYFKETFDIPKTIPEMIDDWNRMAYDKYMYDVELKEGAGDFLDYLQEHGIYMAIATSNTKALTEAALYSHHILSYFDVIVTGEDIHNGKPEPDVYLRASELLGIEPEECLVFEDIPAGILAGLNADMRVCGVRDGYSQYCEKEKKELAHYYINSYEDILNGTYEVLRDGE